MALAVPDLSKANYDTFMPTVIKIVGVILFIYLVGLLIIIYLGMLKNNHILIKNETSAMKNQTFQEYRLPLSEADGGLSWSFVSWLYVEDWNYRFGQKKAIMNWGDNLLMYFDEKSNDLHIDIMTLPSGNVETLVYKDIPLQRWFSLIVVLDGRNLDLFIDGKLVASRFLAEVPHYLSDSLVVCQEGGFRGKIGYLQYMNYRIPQFGIVHFQGLAKKFNGSSPFYKFYNQFWFGIVFGFKMSFQQALILGDRIFKKLNFFSVDMVFVIMNYIRQFFSAVLDLFNRLIFRWA